MNVANGNLPGFLRAGPKMSQVLFKDMIYCFKNYEILTLFRAGYFTIVFRGGSMAKLPPLIFL